MKSDVSSTAQYACTLKMWIKSELLYTFYTHWPTIVWSVHFVSPGRIYHRSPREVSPTIQKSHSEGGRYFFPNQALKPLLKPPQYWTNYKAPFFSLLGCWWWHMYGMSILVWCIESLKMCISINQAILNFVRCQIEKCQFELWHPTSQISVISPPELFSWAIFLS